MRNSKLRRKILEISEGILATATDVVLFEIYFGLIHATSGGGPSSKKVWRDYYEAEEALEELNYETLKRAFARLQKKGLIEYIKEETLTIPKITKQGKERLSTLLPRYYPERSWDGKIYLFTYDVPEKQRGDRDALRLQLEKIGWGKLQDSVWISPDNPRDILKDFLKERRLEGTAVVSDVGKDGSIGQMTLKELVAAVYNLHLLNNDYHAFIEKYSKGKEDKVFPTQIALEFFSILNRDPQLPFELLPHDWQGDNAYELFCKLTGKNQLEEIWTEAVT